MKNSQLNNPCLHPFTKTEDGKVICSVCGEPVIREIRNTENEKGDNYTSQATCKEILQVQSEPVSGEERVAEAAKHFVTTKTNGVHEEFEAGCYVGFYEGWAAQLSRVEEVVRDVLAKRGETRIFIESATTEIINKLKS